MPLCFTFRLPCLPSHRSPLPDPEEALLLELAGAGLNRAILMGPAATTPNRNHHNNHSQQQQQQRPALGRVARHLSHMGAGVGATDIAKAVAAAAGAGAAPPAPYLGDGGSSLKANVTGTNSHNPVSSMVNCGVAMQQQLQQLLLPAIKEVDSAGPATPLAAPPPYNHINYHHGGAGGGPCRAAAAGDVAAVFGFGRTRRTLTTPL